MQNEASPIRPLIAMAGAILALIIGCVGMRAYASWYEGTLPKAPIPPGATRFLRAPEAEAGYASSIGRYWYYERYSTNLAPEAVEEFYRVNQAAAPFGGFDVSILPPRSITRDIPQPEWQERLRHRLDPPNKTVIALEISWKPIDADYSVLSYLLLYVAACTVGFIATLVWYIRAVLRTGYVI
jgi:hypothetical protein